MTTTPAPTGLDLDTLKALEQAATPAPWKADTETRGDCVLWGPDGQFVANAQAEPHWLPAADGGKRAVMFDVDRRDVALIEAMRNALPALLDELANARTLIEGYGELLKGQEDRAERNLASSVQASSERDAAREELAKTRAELDEAKAALTKARDMAMSNREQNARIARSTNDADTVLRHSMVVMAYDDVLDVLNRASPATTAEPADEPKATCGCLRERKTATVTRHTRECHMASVARDLAAAMEDVDVPAPSSSVDGTTTSGEEQTHG